MSINGSMSIKSTITFNPTLLDPVEIYLQNMNLLDIEIKELETKLENLEEIKMKFPYDIENDSFINGTRLLISMKRKDLLHMKLRYEPLINVYGS